MHMTFRTLFLIALLALLAVFTVINWNAVIAPTTLTLLYTDVQAPIGLVMLGVAVVLTAVFLLYSMALQAAALLENRRVSKQLESQRALADQSELSRLTELRHYLQTELHQLALHQSERHEALTNRLNQLQQSLGGILSSAENAVATQLGEIDDRLHRSAGSMPPSYQMP